MKKITLYTVLSLASVALAACGGHYDKDGNYTTYDTNGRTVIDTDGNRTFVPDDAPASTRPVPPPQVHETETQSYAQDSGDITTTKTTTVTTYGYVKPGYYDANGFYIAPGYGPSVPQYMMPPPGLCRIWYPGRQPQDEPGFQSCDGVRSRVPMGAYVIYGG